MTDVFLLDEDRAPSVEQPGLAQVIDLLEHITTKREVERRDMLASTFVSLTLDELMILVTEVSRSIFDQLAAQLMLRTPERSRRLGRNIPAQGTRQRMPTAECTAVLEMPGVRPRISRTWRRSAALPYFLPPEFDEVEALFAPCGTFLASRSVLLDLDLLIGLDALSLAGGQMPFVCDRVQHS